MCMKSAKRDDRRDTRTGDIQRAAALYEDTAVDEDEFSFVMEFSRFTRPNISRYMTAGGVLYLPSKTGRYTTLHHGREAWLVRPGDEKIGIWSIYTG